MKHEREIDLRDLLNYVLKKWRVIIIIGIIVALLAGAGKFVSGVKSNTPDVDISGETDERDVTREKLAKEVDDLQTKLDDQKEYNEFSVLMKTNPQQKYVSSFIVYPDSQYKINPNTTYQDADISTALKATYATFLGSEELYAYVFDNTDCNKDIDGKSELLSELIVVTTEEDNPVLTVQVFGDTAERAHQNAEAVKQAVRNEYTEIKNAVGEHRCSIIMESEYAVVDYELKQTQSDNLALVDEYELNLTTKSAQLDTLGNPDTVQPKLSAKQIAISAIKSAVIGGIAGLIVAAAVCFVMAIQSRKMWSTASWDCFGIPVFGEVNSAKNHRKFGKIDSWIDRKTGHAVTTENPEDAAKLAALNVATALKDNGAVAAVIGTLEKTVCTDTVDAMNKASSGAFCFAGNILTEPEAVANLSDKDEVILLADGEKITTDEVSRIKMLLSVWGKKLLGVILMK